MYHDCSSAASAYLRGTMSDPGHHYYDMPDCTVNHVFVAAQRATCINQDS